MQSLRRLASGFYSSPARQFATKQLSEGKYDKAIQREQIGLYIMLVVSVGMVARDIIYPEEEFEGKIPYYPYLRIRTKDEFPWGPDGLMEFHRFVADKPEGM